MGQEKIICTLAIPLAVTYDNRKMSREEAVAWVTRSRWWMDMRSRYAVSDHSGRLAEFNLQLKDADVTLQENREVTQ